jgi:hypothetical protein
MMASLPSRSTLTMAPARAFCRSLHTVAVRGPIRPMPRAATVQVDRPVPPPNVRVAPAGQNQLIDDRP